MPSTGSPVRASRLHSAISNSPRGIVTRDKSPSKQENEVEPYQTIPSWNSPEKLGQMRPDMRVALPPKADGSPAAREAARRLAVSKERMPDEGLYAIINPILDTGEQLAETAGPMVQSGVNFLAEVVTSPFKGDPWKRTAEWKARKLREEALRVAQEIQREDELRAEAKQRADEERQRHWEDLVQQAAEREAEQLRLAHEAFLNEKLAAEANAKAAELEAKAAALAEQKATESKAQPPPAASASQPKIPVEVLNVTMDLKLKQIKAKLGLDENEAAITADVLAEMVPIEGNLEQKIGKLHEKLMGNLVSEEDMKAIREQVEAATKIQAIMRGKQTRSNPGTPVIKSAPGTPVIKDFEKKDEVATRAAPDVSDAAAAASPAAASPAAASSTPAPMVVPATSVVPTEEMLNVTFELKLKQIKAKLGMDENDEAITAEVLADMVPIQGTTEHKITRLHKKLMTNMMSDEDMKAIREQVEAATKIQAIMRGKQARSTPSTPKEAPKAEAQKAEPAAPATEAPKVDAPKAESAAPATEAPKVEAPNVDATKAEAPTPATEAPKVEAPKAEPDTPAMEAPKVDAPKAEPDTPAA